jgi:hypothetical protein
MIKKSVSLLLLPAFLATVLASGCVFSEGQGLPCAWLPDAEHVRKVVEEHNGTIAQLEEKDRVWIEVDEHRCPGKADILIYYSTLTDRKRIKELIGDDFFGVPYRMFNV